MKSEFNSRNEVLRMAKLILVDNFNREHIADVLVEDNLDEKEANERANKYNDEHRNMSWNWFAKTVSDDYKLWRGMEELV